MLLNKKKNAGNRAFTMLEVVVAVGIFVLLSGALYTIIQASMQITSDLAERQARLEEIYGFMDLCDEMFRTLPAHAVIESVVQTPPLVIFKNAPRAFSWGEMGTTPGHIYLGGRPQQGGLLSMSLLRRMEEGDELILPDNEKWLVLVRDLTKIEWRFRDPISGEWIKEWKERDDRPPLVELTLSVAGEKIPIRGVFWLPPLEARRSS